ncbi:sortase-like acyltransferase [Beggiatoa alba B18LD]|uniref:Sortase-like acyltransferase n=1 Tax=Beggiatoa alba B18LD TaxID=395493 RepID=I3CD72_9GAMM|nr:GNAT family N-acetyltransferase [Beggiatoa alba]EIJ41565.1 sortase-like acyltransferase [Beggiatoa alba B18LD]
MSNILIRRAIPADAEQLWKILHAVIQTGETYSFAPETDKKTLLDYWLSSHVWTYVALIENEIVGTYLIKENHAGQGAHVANASFMVAPTRQGFGIGKALGMHALAEAKSLGFLAMQFNLVVSTNTQAVALWKRLNFNIVGQLPQVFKHPKLGFVDAFVMHRFL